jgi:hypothetical protein
MAASRKIYIQVAQALREADLDPVAKRDLAVNLGIIFRRDNARFSMDKFIDAVTRVDPPSINALEDLP